MICFQHSPFLFLPVLAVLSSWWTLCDSILSSFFIRISFCLFIGECRKGHYGPWFGYQFSHHMVRLIFKKLFYLVCLEGVRMRGFGWTAASSCLQPGQRPGLVKPASSAPCAGAQPPQPLSIDMASTFAGGFLCTVRPRRSPQTKIYISVLRKSTIPSMVVEAKLSFPLLLKAAYYKEAFQKQILVTSSCKTSFS